MAQSLDMAQSAALPVEQYNYDIVRKFTIMAMVWAVIGMSVGVYIASELAWPFLNYDIPQLTFGRLRPVHTTLVIFGFGGCALFATSYYIVQRTSQARLAFPWLAEFTFWGWQAGVALGALSYVSGITQGREYAEFEWPLDIAITLVWVSYFAVYVETLRRRSQPHIYVANWFYLAFILAVALLHIFNNLAVPVSLTKSYSLFSGVQDAMTQWWYGHNAVGPDRRVPGHDVLLCAQASWAAGVLLPAVDHSFLGADLPVHVGGWPSPALDLATGLGVHAGCDLLGDSADAVLGRHD